VLSNYSNSSGDITLLSIINVVQFHLDKVDSDRLLISAHSTDLRMRSLNNWLHNNTFHHAIWTYDTISIIGEYERCLF
jgi:hypothetical protein